MPSDPVDPFTDMASSSQASYSPSVKEEVKQMKTMSPKQRVASAKREKLIMDRFSSQIYESIPDPEYKTLVQ
jgi:hypothetical protein